MSSEMKVPFDEILVDLILVENTIMGNAYSVATSPSV
jgi:hypothetical protein